MGFSFSSLRQIPETTRGLLNALLYAVVAAGSAVAFLWLTNLLFRVTIARLATGSLLVFVLGSLGVITITSLAAGVLMNRVSPDTAGSGVPQLKAAYWKDLGFVRMRAVVVKFVGGILTLGGGTSLGREGPSVYVGGGAASGLAAAFGVPKNSRRLPAATGAAAALAAAFNTPLAAITFVLEEMLNNEFGSRVLGSVVLAAVTGALIVQAFLGRQPAFSLPSVEGVTWLMYVTLPIVAAVASLIGVAFQSLTLSLRARVRDRSRLPAWLRPVCGSLVTWALGCVVFAVTGQYRSVWTRLQRPVPRTQQQSALAGRRSSCRGQVRGNSRILRLGRLRGNLLAHSVPRRTHGLFSRRSLGDMDPAHSG